MSVNINGKLTSWILFFIAATIVTSCKKESSRAYSGENIEWMHVIDESVYGTTEEDPIQGQNGKVLTDQAGNIYLYYYDEVGDKTIVIKCDPDGSLVWKKTLNDCNPSDMILLPNGNLVLSGREAEDFPNYVIIYQINANGNYNRYPIYPAIVPSRGVINANLHAMQDNSIIISGVYFQAALVGFPYKRMGFVLKLNSTFNTDWNVLSSNVPLNTGLVYYSIYNQNSVASTPDGKLIVQYSISADKIQQDSINYGYLTAVLDPDSASFDIGFFKQTGFEVQSNGNKGGYYNRYCNGLIEDNGTFIHYYSSPVLLSNTFPQNPSGFIRINSNSQILDTIPIPMPAGYRITSCTKNNNAFLMTAYKSDVIDVNGDFSANQTLMLSGSNWQTSKSYIFQKFYSDFFYSSAPAIGGGFILMGKIQSFNGPNKKLVLIKIKNEL